MEKIHDMTDKKHQKPKRAERIRQEAAEKKRQRLLKIWLPVGAGTILVIAVITFYALRPDVQGLLTFGAQSRDHDTSATFNAAGLPPTGGTHNPSWQNCGIYDEPLDNALAVHSLEHGAVWLAYQPELSGQQVAALRELVRGSQYTLMSPYPGLEAPVVVSAWSRQLIIEDLADARLEEFIDRYQQKGPEPGALCSQGVGVPIE